MFFFVLQIDQDTNDLLRSLNMVNLPGVKMVPVSPLYIQHTSADILWLLPCFQCCQKQIKLRTPFADFAAMHCADYSSSTHAYGTPRRRQQRIWSTSVWWTAAIDLIV